MAGSNLRACWLLLAVGCGPTAAQDPSARYSETELMDPATCGACHPQQYEQWSGSMHAYASEDPLFLAMNQRGQEVAQIGPFCVNCHAPMAVRTRASSDGTNLASLPNALKGVTCYFCHVIDRATGAHDASVHLGEPALMRGPLTDAAPNSAHGSAYSTLHDRARLESASLCGSCHDIVNGHGAHVERTFAEWEESVFATSGGNTCGQCHMSQSAAPGPASSLPGAPLRNLHDHQFPGVDLALTDFPQADAQRQAVQSFLDTTLQTALCVRGLGAQASVFVVVDNVAAGHRWPSGAAQDRRAWFELNAYSAGVAIYQSGVAPVGASPADSDLWLIQDCLFDAQGERVDTFWDAATTDSNQLPGQLTFDANSPLYYRTHVTQSYPRSGQKTLSAYPDRVTLDVHLLAFPFELFEDLFSEPARLRLSAADVQALRAKLVPLDVGKQLEWTAAAAADTAHGGSVYFEQGVPVRCVTNTGLNAAADKQPAPVHANPACTP